MLDRGSLDGALAETVDKQILVVDPTEAGYRFRHALLRESVYATLLPGECSRLHRQVATALATDSSLGPSEPGRLAAELAWHWWTAGEWAAAFSSSMCAANAATAVWAFPEALDHLERALAALDRTPSESVPPGTDRLDLLEKASNAAYLAREGQRSVDLARAAIHCVDVGADPKGAARLYIMLGRNAWSIDDPQAAFDANRQAAALLSADEPSVELARVLAAEASWLMIMSRHRDAEPRCHDAITVARAVGARAEEGHALNTLGCSRALLGHYDEGIGLVHEALVIAEELGLPDHLDRAYGNLSALLVEAGRLEEAAALVYDSSAVGEQVWGVMLNGAAGNGSDALIRLGRFDEAEALVAKMGERGVGSCVSLPLLAPVPIAIRRGRFGDAARLLAAVDELTAARHDVQTRGLFHMLTAELALEQDRPDDAYGEVERALALAAGTDDETFRPEMCALGVRALADELQDARARGRRLDADKARLLALGLVHEADRMVAAPEARGTRCTPRATAFASTCAAERSRLQQSDPDLWAEAASRWDAAREPYPAAYCRWREAEALLEGRTGRSRAHECLQTAWRTSVEMGTLPLSERIERLAQRARIPLAEDDHAEPLNGSTLAGDLGLTPREVEVLGQLAAGRTDREIAEELFVSKKTASVHVSNLLRKLNVTNRVEAGKIGQAHGLG
jgi:DNA-binding CsgD family transcriptional regulator/tetratricopeptide (TPR) repeat protein